VQARVVAGVVLLESHTRSGLAFTTAFGHQRRSTGFFNGIFGFLKITFEARTRSFPRAARPLWRKFRQHPA